MPAEYRTCYSSGLELTETSDPSSPETITMTASNGTAICFSSVTTVTSDDFSATYKNASGETLITIRSNPKSNPNEVTFVCPDGTSYDVDAACAGFQSPNGTGSGSRASSSEAPPVCTKGACPR